MRRVALQGSVVCWKCLCWYDMLSWMAVTCCSKTNLNQPNLKARSMTPYRFGTVQDRFEHRFGKIQNGPKRCQNGVQNENDLESLPMQVTPWQAQAAEGILLPVHGLGWVSR